MRCPPTVAAALSGGLVACSLPDRGLWPLAWFAFAPLLLALDGAGFRRAFGLGLVTGLATNLLGLGWLVGLLERFGPLPFGWAVLCYALYAAYQALVFALFAVGLVTLRGRLGLPRWLVAPLLMVSAEWLVPLVFPWNLGMSQARVLPIVQLAELGGPFAVTALLLLVNGALVDGFRERRLRAPLLAGVATGTALLFGHARIQQIEAQERAAAPLTIGVVEGHVRFDHAGTPPAARLEALQQSSRELASRGAELVLWSETAYPFTLPADLAQDFPDSLAFQIGRGLHVPLLFGAPTKDAHGVLRNSAFLRAADGRIAGRYDKNELVTFGERVPFDDVLPALQKLRLSSAGHFQPGREVASFALATATGAVRIAPLVCLEDVLPAMGRRVGALHPDLLVNVSNDAWFGPSGEPLQHLALAVFRSVEQRIPMVRAVNGGASAFVTATGRIVHETAPRASRPGEHAAQGVLATLRPIEGGHTFYARHGDLFAHLCLALVLVGLTLPLRVRVRASARALFAR